MFRVYRNEGYGLKNHIESFVYLTEAEDYVKRIKKDGCKYYINKDVDYYSYERYKM